MLLKRITNEGLGAGPPPPETLAAAGRFKKNFLSILCVKTEEFGGELLNCY